MDITKEELVEFSQILPKRTNEWYGVAREHPTRYISRLVFRDFNQIGHLKFFDTSIEIGPEKYAEMTESDVYEKIISPDIEKAKRHKVYKNFFSKKFSDSAKESIIGYLKEFPLLKNADFDKPEQYPFTEYFIMDTYCSLAYLFAEYLADLERYSGSKPNKHQDDYIRHLSEVDESCKTLRSHLSSDAPLPLELYQSVDLDTLARMQDELSLKINELKVIGKNGKELPERILMIRLGYNLLSIKTGGKGPLVDCFWTHNDPEVLVRISKHDDYFKYVGDDWVPTGVEQFQSKISESVVNDHQVRVTETRMHKWCLDFCTAQSRELGPTMAKNQLRGDSNLKRLFEAEK